MQSFGRRRFLAAGAGLAAAIAFGRPVLAQLQAGGVTRNIIDTLAAGGRFNEVLGMVGQAGFTDRGLAPTNPAPAQQAAGFGTAGAKVMPPAAIMRPDIRATNGTIHVNSGPLLA